MILLKKPAAPERLRVAFAIHDTAPARKITVLLDGVQVAEQTYASPGRYVLESTPVTGSAVTIW